jgi:hypothetical protein
MSSSVKTQQALPAPLQARSKNSAHYPPCTTPGSIMRASSNALWGSGQQINKPSPTTLSTATAMLSLRGFSSPPLRSFKVSVLIFMVIIGFSMTRRLYDMKLRPAKGRLAEKSPFEKSFPLKLNGALTLGPPLTSFKVTFFTETSLTNCQACAPPPDQ